MSKESDTKVPEVTTSTDLAIEDKELGYGELRQKSQDEEEFLLLKDITVKFRIMKFHIVTHAYPNIYTIDEVKKDISTKFQIQQKYLVLKQVNYPSPLKEDQRLFDLCDNDFGVIDMDVELTENASLANVRLEPQLYYK